MFILLYPAVTAAIARSGVALCRVLAIGSGALHYSSFLHTKETKKRRHTKGEQFLRELCPFVFFVWKPFSYFSSHKGNEVSKEDEGGSVLCELYDWNQQKVSLLEQKETIDPRTAAPNIYCIKNTC